MAIAEQEKVGLGHFIGRKVYQKLSKFILPTEIQPANVGDGIDGVQRARSLLEEGIGLVVIYTHPSRTDTYRLMELWKYDEFAKRRCLTPIAYHQYNKLATITASPTGLEFYPLVTPETMERIKKEPNKYQHFKDLKENQGFLRVLESSVEALSGGGIILYAPATTRTAELSMPPGRLRPTDMLLGMANMRGVRFAVLFTAFEINGVTSYPHASGLNVFRKYTLHTGSTLLDTEILDKLTKFRKDKNLPENPRRPFNDTDQWLYETQLPLLVPPAYHPKPLST